MYIYNIYYILYVTCIYDIMCIYTTYYIWYYMYIYNIYYMLHAYMILCVYIQHSIYDIICIYTTYHYVHVTLYMHVQISSSSSMLCVYCNEGVSAIVGITTIIIGPAYSQMHSAPSLSLHMCMWHRICMCRYLLFHQCCVCLCIAYMLCACVSMRLNARTPRQSDVLWVFASSPQMSHDETIPE